MTPTTETQTDGTTFEPCLTCGEAIPADQDMCEDCQKGFGKAANEVQSIEVEPSSKAPGDTTRPTGTSILSPESAPATSGYKGSGATL